MYNQIKSQENLYLIYEFGGRTFASNSNEIRRILDISNPNLNNIVDQVYNGFSRLRSHNIKKGRSLYNIKGNEDECVIIIETSGVVKQKIGIIVTKVKKLVDIDKNDFLKIPHIGINLNDYFVEKYIKVDNEIVGILNIDKLLQKESSYVNEKYMM